MLIKEKQVIYRISKQLYQKVFNTLCFDLGDYRQSIFLAGTGRSGTTWLAEVINYDNSFRIMFEPFHSYKIDVIKDWNYRQYLRSNNHDTKFVNPANAILSGNIKHPWIDQFNHKLVARKRLIKDIRANLLLNWVKKNFPEIPIVLLIRHPCAVASSKLKLGWNSHLSDFLKQEELMDEFLNPFKNEIEDVIDTFEKHIFMWCIENYVPLRQFDEGEILVVFYESLCQNPEKEAERVFSFLGKDVPVNILQIASKPSELSRKDSAVISGENPLSLWRKHITEEQIERALEILSIFGLEAVYGYDDLPLLCGENVLNELKDYKCIAPDRYSAKKMEFDCQNIGRK